MLGTSERMESKQNPGFVFVELTLYWGRTESLENHKIPSVTSLVREKDKTPDEEGRAAVPGKLMQRLEQARQGSGGGEWVGHC